MLNKFPTGISWIVFLAAGIQPLKAQEAQEAAPPTAEMAAETPEPTATEPTPEPLAEPSATPTPETPSPTPEPAATPAESVPEKSSPKTDSEETPLPKPTPLLASPELAPILNPDQNTPAGDSIFSVEPDINLVPQDQKYPLSPSVLPETTSSKAYPVSKFTFKYAPEGRDTKTKLPDLASLVKDPVLLGKTSDSLVPAGKGTEDIQVSLENLTAKSLFTAEALREIFSALQKRLNDQNIYGVLVSADPDQIDGDTLKDKRPTTPAPENLTVLIYVGEIKEIRTVTKRIGFREPAPPLQDPAKPIKLREGSLPTIDEPRYVRIKEKSPLQPGSLLDKGKLEDYLGRLNRFPGRRVDVAINASGEPGGVILDYLVREDKPWTVYAQSTNTGTQSTGEWRTQVGAEYRQLAKLDDILAIDFTTSDLSSSNNLNASYQVTPIFPDVLKAKVYGSYGKFTASDVGFDNQNFEGESWKIGSVLTWTPLRYKDFPLDISLGAEWVDVSVANRSFLADGKGEFLIAYFGVGTEKKTDRYSIFGNMRVETNLSSFTSTSDADLPALGRFNTNNDFIIGKFSFGASFFLEPLLLGAKFRTPNEPNTWTMAQEFVFSGHGQFTFNDHRLIPQFEDTVGGFYTVRGYPESLAAGDNTYVGTAEYRLHIPRLLAPWKVPEATPDARQTLGKFPFAMKPSILGEGVDFPDWDFIFRAFVDAGYNQNNRIEPTSEVDRTMVGAGIGLELQLLNTISIRADYGIALIEEKDLLVDPVDAGSGRFHFSISLVW